eukprot:9233288-Alexandrium_andersonii.AAC.1
MPHPHQSVGAWCNWDPALDHAAFVRHSRSGTRRGHSWPCTPRPREGRTRQGSGGHVDGAVREHIA